MIYVDAATWKKPNGRKAYAHMVADSIEELHEFAAKIGVKPHFFHRSKTAPHYDINADQQQAAVDAGAQQVSSREILEKAKNLLPSELGAFLEAMRRT